MHKILIIDDDPHMQRLIKMLLEANGYVTRGVEDPSAACDAIAAFMPDLVILDYLMQGKNGLELLKEVKTAGHKCDVIVITGHGSEKLAVEMMKFGATDYLQKPFEKKTLLETIKKTLSARTAISKSVTDSNILVLDDDRPVLNFMKKSLAGLGNIVTETDPRAALSLLEERHFDILITDINMPHIDGIEVLKRTRIRNPITSIIVMTATSSMGYIRDAMKHGAYDYLIKPFKPEEVRESVSELLIAKRREVFESLKRQFEIQEMREEERSEFILGTIEALIMALEARDNYTHGHSERVTSYSEAIALEMGLDKKEVEAIRHSARLHDLGKIGTDDSHLYKEGKLTGDEMSQVAKHPVLGAVIVNSIKFLEDYVSGIKHHHERYDGSGYPDGLVGEDIPLPARIICVADAIDAMLSSRPYRKGLPLSVVIEELKKHSGAQFDPAVVVAILALIERDALALNVEHKEDPIHKAS